MNQRPCLSIACAESISHPTIGSVSSQNAIAATGAFSFLTAPNTDGAPYGFRLMLTQHSPNYSVLRNESILTSGVAANVQTEISYTLGVRPAYRDEIYLVASRSCTYALTKVWVASLELVSC